LIYPLYLRLATPALTRQPTTPAYTKALSFYPITELFMLSLYWNPLRFPRYIYQRSHGFKKSQCGLIFVNPDGSRRLPGSFREHNISKTACKSLSVIIPVTLCSFCGKEVSAGVFHLQLVIENTYLNLHSSKCTLSLNTVKRVRFFFGALHRRFLRSYWTFHIRLYHLCQYSLEFYLFYTNSAERLVR
jgi:hypothetical protein